MQKERTKEPKPRKGELAKEESKRHRKHQPQPFWALATQSCVGATKKAVVRAVSGFAPRRNLLNF
jgi:hypothetical protein